MVITVTQKVQLMVLVGCLAIGCYFYILHKDLERHVGELHDRVQYLLKVNAPQGQGQTIAPSSANQSNQSESHAQPESEPVQTKHKTEIEDDVDDDVASVTSNDIKDLLTNIYNDDGDGDADVDVDVPEQKVTKVEPVPFLESESESEAVQVQAKDIQVDELAIDDSDEIHINETVPVTVAVTVTNTVIESIQKAPDIGQMTDDEIMKIKYDDLRSYLRKHGVNIKGNKQEMLTKIRQINAPFAT